MELRFLAPAAAILLHAFAMPALAGSCALPEGGKALMRDVVARINAERADHGLPRLKEDAKLGKAAQAHACDQAALGIMSHDSANGDGLGQRLKRAGYGFRVGAENIAAMSNPEGVVALWMGSPGHRANILDPRVTAIGLGVALGDGRRGRTHYFAMNVARPR